MNPPKATIDNRVWRILIVEDEPMLAFVLEELLVSAGYVVVGVASRLEAALSIITDGICDAAILDTNLAGVSAAPIASALASRAIPFLVLSGYSAAQQDKAFSGVTYLQKPCRPERITQALRSILPDH
jgi:CheY-like chemotaxis protein